MSDLDEILSGAEPPHEPTEEVTTEPEATEEVKDESEATTGDTTEDSQEPSKEEDSTPEPKKSDNEQSWQFEAYKDEKRKRQELERKLEEISNTKEPEKAPDVFDNQEGYTQYIQNQISQSQLAMKAEMSQFHAERELGKDVVSKKLESFREMVKENPTLQQQVLSSYSPIHEAIDIVNKAEKLQQLENVESMEAKIRQEIEAKIKAEMEEKYKAESQKQKSVTPSLNNTASAKSTDVESTLEDLLSGR